MSETMNIHSADGVKLVRHWMREDTEWAKIRIGDIEITVFERTAIDDALRLPRSHDFDTNIPAPQATK